MLINQICIRGGCSLQTDGIRNGTFGIQVRQEQTVDQCGFAQT